MWNYQTAFSRNLGLIRPEEQKQLRRSHVAILGLGGVGGINLVTLARMGIGHFTIADPDIFEIANFNRQYGATLASIGMPKAEVMRDIILDINPEAEIRIFQEPIGTENIDQFLKGVDVLVDSIDAFEIDARRLAHQKAKDQGIYALGAGPVGFSTVWVIFSPSGMCFDDYFGLDNTMTPQAKFIAYITGMAPAALQRRYLDLNFVDMKQKTGPSIACACQLAAGIIGAEVAKILLKRGQLYCAPYYHQFDPYLNRYVRRRLFFGNRHPWQRLKRRWLANQLKHLTKQSEE